LIEEWRLIWVDTIGDCYYNMGLDKAILNAVSNEKVPNTIRLYRWDPSAVSIGYFQSMRNVVNLEQCDKVGVNYIRRITGGGAVYHDFEGEMTYSVNCLNTENRFPQDITKIYEIICGGIVDGLTELGVSSEFKPINDIVLKKTGKKISGSALTRKQGVVSQHGTILRKVDVERMFSLLIVPDEKIKDKLISSAKERVSSLELELGQAPSFEDIGNSLISGLESKLNIKLLKEEITKEEVTEAEKFAKEQFKSEEWMFKR